MNAQEISIRHSALGWIKKSIDDNLSDIKSDLKRYLENKEQGLLEGVKQRLGVIRGVLVMIEQYGAAMLTEEMAALVDFIVVEKESKDDQALEVLLRAVLQLPDYLEHIQSGHHDIPITILPLLNDVRAVRNQDLFSEKLLFLPDLSMHEDEAEIEAIDDASNQASRLLAKKLRPVYQLALVNIIRERSVEESLKRLEKICEALEERSVSEQIARIWWIVGALIESVARQQLELGVSIKNLLGKVDALFRVILIIGERGLLRRQPIELIKNFLFYVAQPECDGPKAQAIKTAYRLEQFLPSESARSEVLENIAGPNQALLKTVAEAMKAEIETIKSTLEVYVNGDLSQVSTLKDLPQEMHIISDTLAMIGLGAQRQMIEAQIDAVKNILTAGKAVDEELLLSMAAELLQVEQALEQMSKRQPNRTEQPRTESDVSRDYELDSVLSAVVTAALDDIQKTKTAILEFIKDPEHSDNIELCITLMLESRGAMQLLEQQRAVTVVDGLLRYLRGYEVNSFMESERLDALSQVVVSLEYFLEALGEHRSDASSILDLADIQLQKLLVGLSRDNEIRADEQRIVPLPKSADGNSEVTENAPDHGLVAEIVEAAAAQEPDNSHLEDTQVLEHDSSAGDSEQPRVMASPRPDAEGIDKIKVVEGLVQEEQQESNPDIVPEAPEMDATQVMSVGGYDAEMQASAESGGSAKVGAESAGKSSAADHDATETDVSSLSQTVEIVPVDDGAEVLKSGNDAEILEIYLEEAEEEASNIVRLQKDWMLHPEDENALKNIRRAFHTIKGSGRLVGALKIGEFAWDYEQLLNRIIDKTVPPERAVINAVGKAGKALSELVHELKTFEEPTSDIPYLRGLARALAEFKTEDLLIDHTQTMSIIESPYDHITDAEEDEGETVDAGLGATTQIIEPDNGAVELPDRADAGASEDSIAPETPQEKPEAEPAAATPDISKYDDTVLTEAPPIPSMDNRRQVEAAVRAKIAAVARARAAASYQRAADYSKVSEVSPDDDAESSASRVSEERESERPTAIEIESIGDDFVGESLIGNSEVPAVEASLMQAQLTPTAPAEIADLPPIEFEEVALPGDGREEANDLAGESDKDELPVGEQPEAEEIEMQAFEVEPEAEEIEMQAFEVEPEAEEIEMQAFGEEPETEEIEMQAFGEEPGAEEIEVQAFEEEPGAEEIEVQESAEEFEAEEITMETPLHEAETEEFRMPESAEEFEAEEITMETPVEESAAEEIEFESLEDSITGGDVDSSPAEASPGEAGDFETPADREDPPDPFVVTTTSPMPGVEAEASESRAQGQAEPTDLSFDPELLTIYQQEVEQHLDTVNSALDHAEKIRELIPGEEIYRALHTIHGASRTADIGSIGELAALLEKPLKMAIAQHMALDLEIVALYREGQRALHEMTAELVSTRQMPDIPADLKISLQALAADFEEHTVDLSEVEKGQAGDFIETLTMMNESVDSEQGKELLTIFIDEANELLEMSDNTLHQWSQQQLDDPGAQDYNAVMELQRYLHTLKGGARMAELKEISDLSHEMESLFIAVIDGRVEKSENLIEMLKDAFDLLHGQVNEAQEGGNLSGSSDMVRILKKLRRGEDNQSRGDVSEEPADLDVGSEGIDIVSENLPGNSSSGMDRSAQDVIKVRADLLDNLVSSAGEVSIYRARMEQQVAGLGSHLGELGQTITRLKAQLRSLEAETDAQIHFSHRSESSSRTGEFDPLEMDRYTSIQELSRSLGESVNDLSSLQHLLGDQVKDSETLLLQQSRVNTDLQDGLIKSRMVKFSGLLTRLRRLVRQSSQELGKKAELLVTGEQNEVDNKVLDRMVAPLEHIIRNALSHGIETPVERVKKGKPEAGRIAIDITRDGSDVVIKVSDDGAGVDIEKVRSRAIQLGLLEQGRVASETDLVQYILEPGFSTAEHVTQLSGRGVGMDVVDIEVKQLGGTLQIESTPQGTTFVARLPFTLSINQAILVRCGDETYAIPLLNIEGITRIDAQQMHDFYNEDAPQLEYAGQNFALHNLARLVGAESPFRAGIESEKQAVILGRAGDLRVALHVDEIIGNREIVVKTLGKQLSQVKSLAGASILADGSVVLILDIAGLIRQNVGSTVKIVYNTPPDKVSKLRDTVMVVDDSITMRRVATKLLERHNYEVITAKDGVDALAQLQDVRPDVLLLDIEMPRMDGFELATHMQNEASFSSIPIIMITSRTGEKHRDRAIEIGITNYMGKPYQEKELIQNIQSALGDR
jgi:chemosensory pili system protein ChpA (sensor histidine kinase/response regulator)